MLHLVQDCRGDDGDPNDIDNNNDGSGDDNFAEGGVFCGDFVDENRTNYFPLTVI
jgi:hypothetical protein